MLWGPQHVGAFRCPWDSSFHPPSRPYKPHIDLTRAPCCYGNNFSYLCHYIVYGHMLELGLAAHQHHYHWILTHAPGYITPKRAVIRDYMPPGHSSLPWMPSMVAPTIAPIDRPMDRPIDRLFIYTPTPWRCDFGMHKDRWQKRSGFVCKSAKSGISAPRYGLRSILAKDLVKIKSQNLELLSRNNLKRSTPATRHLGRRKKVLASENIV